MYFKSILNYIGLLFFVALFSFRASGQAFSYIYIQGDKQTPFYVKLDDQMQPRYGRNYSIISQLAAGIINIEILFQQNRYPSQKFSIKVPDNSYRGFILTHKGNAFSLFDIQQQFYLPAGNSIEDDHIPVTDPNKAYVSTNKTTEEPVVVINEPPKKTTAKKQPDKQVQNNNDPQFIENIELNNEKTIRDPRTVSSPTDDLDNNKSAVNKNALVNSDCPNPVRSSVFEDIYSKAQKHTEKTRLKFLLSKLNNCFTTSQARILAKVLDNDPERYEFLKQAYPHVTDQSNFPLLESLLSTQEWKSYFLLIIQ